MPGQQAPAWSGVGDLTWHWSFPLHMQLPDAARLEEGTALPPEILTAEMDNGDAAMHGSTLYADWMGLEGRPRGSQGSHGLDAFDTMRSESDDGGEGSGAPPLLMRMISAVDIGCMSAGAVGAGTHRSAPGGAAAAAPRGDNGSSMHFSTGGGVGSSRGRSAFAHFTSSGAAAAASRLPSRLARSIRSFGGMRSASFHWGGSFHKASDCCAGSEGGESCSSDALCPICMDVDAAVSVQACMHSMCVECARRLCTMAVKPAQCPLCRATVNQFVPACVCSRTVKCAARHAEGAL